MNHPTTNRTATPPPRKQARPRTPLQCPPVVERELRVALHRGQARKSRFKVALIGVALVSAFMWIGGVTGTKTWGGTLHFFLFGLGLNLAVTPAIRISVGLFAEERRQQTLELLYLTGMGSAELFIGKLLGGAMVASSDLLALAPLMAVPFLSGGLSFDLFAATVVCLPTVFVLVLAAGALGSALCRDDGSALAVSSLLLGVACLALPLPYVLGWWLAGNTPFNASWLSLSPALGPWMVFRKLAGFSAGDFWIWALVTWGWAAVWLTLAAVMLKWNWRRDLAHSGAPGRHSKWAVMVTGKPAWRAALRRRVLDVNPYQWLAQKDRRPVVLAWTVIAALCALWLLGWGLWPGLWPGIMNYYATAVVLLLVKDLLVSHAAGRLMAAGRQDGSLELLLTTPLKPEAMVAGQEAALRQQFRLLRCGLSGLVLLLALAGMLTRNWNLGAIITYLAVWCLMLVWCWRPVQQSAPFPMWVAANCGQPLRALFQPRHGDRKAVPFAYFYFLWLGMSAFAGLRMGLASFPAGSWTELLVTASVMFFVLVFCLSKRRESNELRQRLVAQLRAIAQEPLPERQDPRFKEWRLQMWKRFPAGAAGRFGELPPEEREQAPVKALGGWFWRWLGRACGRMWGRWRNTANLRRRLDLK